MKHDLRQLKRLALIAMVSDDLLWELLSLKGGNLIDLVYDIAGRSSIDLDFSMENEFDPAALEDVRERVNKVLTTTYAEHGYRAFDIKFNERPAHIPESRKDFWGGYRIEFKIISEADYRKHGSNIGALRINAVPLDAGHQRVFSVDISKFEYCAKRESVELDGYRLFVYTPQMLVIEKLRAICQQMPDYASVISGFAPRARARDFFDIHVLMTNCPIDLASQESKDLVKHIFEAKRVPLEYITHISEQREFHRQDFPSLMGTVPPGYSLQDFDFYFDYVIDHCAAPILRGL